MENIRYIPQGQARGISYKTSKKIEFINIPKLPLFLGRLR